MRLCLRPPDNNGLAMRVVQMIVLAGASLALGLTLISCRTGARPVPVRTPKGFAAVTVPQSELVAGIRRLVVGMSPSEVKNRLGRPSEEKPDQLFYFLVEDGSGGYYVTAHLSFTVRGLAAAELGYGHVDIAPQ